VDADALAVAINGRQPDKVHAPRRVVRAPAHDVLHVGADILVTAMCAE
jgi:hypothetical protein